MTDSISMLGTAAQKMSPPVGSYTSPAHTRVGWVGIGVMGGAMAGRLLSAGYSVAVYARSPAKALHLQHLGARLAISLTDLAATSDVVFTMVSHPSDVRSVLLGPGGVLSALPSGAATVDMTTSSPSLAREISASAAAKGCCAIDAPVSGGDIGARDGRLAIFAGGDGETVRWLKPIFDVLGKVTYMGGPGTGQSCKIANQITVSANLLGLSEGLLFAEGVGLDLRQFVEAIGGGAAGSKVMELYGERVIERDFRPGAFAEYMVKDLGMMLDGEEEGIALPGAALCHQLFLGMVANGDRKLGIQALITVLERINGKPRA